MHLSNFMHFIIALLLTSAEATSLSHLQQVMKPPPDFLPAGNVRYAQWEFRNCSEQQVNVFVQGLWDIRAMAGGVRRASMFHETYFRRYHEAFFAYKPEDDLRLEDEYNNAHPEPVTLTNRCTYL
jgi:hypothetical protein